MARLTIGDRVASAFVGTAIGALVGLALAWLLGVYYNTLGPSAVSFGLGKFVLKVSVTFAFVGLIFGPAVGTLLGNVISAMFAFEQPRSLELPSWLLVAILLLAGAGMWWFITR